MSGPSAFRPSAITATEPVAFFDPMHDTWVVSIVRPGTTEKIGWLDAYMNRYVWTPDKPPPGMRVVTERPG